MIPAANSANANSPAMGRNGWRSGDAMLPVRLFAGHNAAIAMECPRPLGCGGGLSFVGPLDIPSNRLNPVPSDQNGGGG